LVLGKTGGVMAAVDMDEGAGEGWGDDADLILDEGEFNSFFMHCSGLLVCGV
jgi:hypothetical protein